MTTESDIIRSLKLLIKMYEAGHSKIPNGFVCSRQRSMSINFLKWVDEHPSGEGKQWSVFRTRLSASGRHSLPTTQCRRPR